MDPRKELAITILDLVEDVLEEHNIVVPDDDRPEDNTTPFYGCTYGDLLYRIMNILPMIKAKPSEFCRPCIKVPVRGGYLYAEAKRDDVYPGIDVGIVDDIGGECIVAGVEFNADAAENPNGDIDLYLFEDPEIDDCTDHVVFDRGQITQRIK